MHSVSLRLKAHLTLLLCSFFWGVTFVVVKNALADISVFAYIAARFILAGVPLRLLVLPGRLAQTHASPKPGPGIQVGFFMFGGYAFQTAGIALHNALEGRIHHRVERGAGSLFFWPCFGERKLAPGPG